MCMACSGQHLSGLWTLPDWLGPLSATNIRNLRQLETRSAWDADFLLHPHELAQMRQLGTSGPHHTQFLRWSPPMRAFGSRLATAFNCLVSGARAIPILHHPQTTSGAFRPELGFRNPAFSGSRASSGGCGTGEARGLWPARLRLQRPPIRVPGPLGRRRDARLGSKQIPQGLCSDRVGSDAGRHV